MKRLQSLWLIRFRHSATGMRGPDAHKKSDQPAAENNQRFLVVAKLSVKRSYVWDIEDPADVDATALSPAHPTKL
jgi:hypothetical protein